jgi:predicted nucleotidyltransferase
MLTPKQIKIFEVFLKKPYAELTYREIKEYSAEKSNSIIQIALSKYVAQGLLVKRKVGNIILYSINFGNNLVFSYFDILIEEKISGLLRNTIGIIREELMNIPFVSIVVFGSYAEGKEDKNSDLDIAIFVNSDEDKKNCSLAMKSAELKSVMQIDAYVFTKEEMLSMLKEKHENLGKQIACKHMVIQNPSIFYLMIQEGIDNGFKVVYPQG